MILKIILIGIAFGVGFMFVLYLMGAVIIPFIADFMIASSERWPWLIYLICLLWFIFIGILFAVGLIL